MRMSEEEKMTKTFFFKGITTKHYYIAISSLFIVRYY